jgi:pyridoxamine 5'-phosphate oxidase
MSNFDEDPKAIYNNIKKLLTTGAKSRKHAFHTPIFSNSNHDYTTESRVVVLRKFDESSLKLTFNTDMRSPKIINLQKNNNSFFVFYDPEIKIQLRIKTQSFINNKNQLTKDSWEQTRLFSRKCYLTEKAPSSKTNIPEDGLPIKLKGIDPDEKESENGYDNFAVIENNILNIDWLYLKSSGHRRLNINFNNSKTLFEWIIP